MAATMQPISLHRFIMHKNTKKLRQLMRKHNVRATEVAELLGREVNTVRVWRVQETKRVIPNDTLELLALKLADSGSGNVRGARK